MNIFQILLIITSFLCSIVSGFLIAFAVVVMPGIKKLSDKEFIKTFQVIDKIIQNGQPIFIIVWVGSIIGIIVTGISAFFHLKGLSLILMIVASLLFILGVHLPTILVNVPLNNKIQSLNVENISEEIQKKERNNFESIWNKWNVTRTVFGLIASLLLIFITSVYINLKI